MLAERLDLLLITHEHEDHFNSETVKLLIEKGHCKFIVPKSCEQKAIGLNIPADRLIIAKPNDELSVGGIKIKCVRAVHGHIGGTIYSGASMLDCGYLFEMNNKVIYQPGDTVLLEEHTQFPKIDILFLSPTEHNTHIENSIKLINWLKPNKILLQHHNTYVEASGGASDNLFWTHGYINELIDKMDNNTKEKTIIPNMDNIIEL